MDVELSFIGTKDILTGITTKPLDKLRFLEFNSSNVA
jgi:hypothetical protein